MLKFDIIIFHEKPLKFRGTGKKKFAAFRFTQI